MEKGKTAHVFISYKSEEKAQASAVRSILESEGFPVWMAPESIASGDTYPTAIGKAVVACSCVVLILSKASQNSRWVEDEITMARSKGKTIVPVLLDGQLLNPAFEFLIGRFQGVKVIEFSASDVGMQKVIASVRAAQQGEELPVRTATPIVSENHSPIEDFKFKLESEGVTITQYEGNDKDVIVPSEINGVKVVKIGDSAFTRQGAENPILESVVIPDGVKEIGRYAFYSCSSLKKVIIPNGVKKIGYSAFEHCRSLTEINLPENLQMIPESAFRGCSELRSITVPKNVTSIGSAAFGACFKLYVVKSKSPYVTVKQGSPDHGEIATRAAFVSNYSDNDENAVTNENGFVIMTENGEKTLISYEGNDSCVTIPDSVTVIRKEAFVGNRKLTKVVIGGKVKVIGNGAFRYCVNMTELVIGERVVKIEDEAFYCCTNLKRVVIPRNVRKVGRLAFFVGVYDNHYPIFVDSYAEEVDFDQEWNGVKFDEDKKLPAYFKGKWKIRDGIPTPKKGWFW